MWTPASSFKAMEGQSKGSAEKNVTLVGAGWLEGRENRWEEGSPLDENGLT